MTKGSMYVGRVGALAVALGVGMAVTSTQSSAWASPESPSAADSAPDNPGSDPTPKDSVDSTQIKSAATEEKSLGLDPATDARKQITHSLRSVIHQFGPLKLPGRDSGGEIRDNASRSAIRCQTHHVIAYEDRRGGDVATCGRRSPTHVDRRYRCTDDTA